MRILADENIPRAMIEALRQEGHAVEAMAAIAPQSTDAEVLARAVATHSVLLTFDSDFGRMIFRQGYPPPPGLIYLRSPPPSAAVAIERVLRVAKAETPSIDGQFVAIDQKARYHPLPEKKTNG